MPNLTDLQRRFAIPGVVAIENDANHLARLVVTTPLAEAHVYLHGAHVTHYQPAGHPPVLFMSGKSWFQESKAIRGGVPLVFPWFGSHRDHREFPAHGFARTRPWTLRSVRQDADGVVELSLALGPDDATRALWPHDFEVVYTVTIGSVLGLALAVRNTGSTPFVFEEALHTYLSVGDVRGVSVTGLGQRDYMDKLPSGRRLTQSGEPITITAETDRVYFGTADTVNVLDPQAPGEGGARTITISKEGSLATVVWNPWVAKAKAMPDFGDDEWPAMLCIETANVEEHAVTLKPGESHVMQAQVQAQRDH